MTRLRLAAAMSIALPLASSGSSPAFAGESTHVCVESAHEGQRLRDAGKLAGAREAFAQCRVDTCPTLVRESCEQWAADVDARLPTIVLGAKDDRGNDLSDVRVTSDGKELTRSLDGRSLPIDPGPHELVFETPGRAPVRQFVVMREGERVRPVVAVLPARAASAASPEPESSPSRLPLVLAGAASVLGFSGFAVFGILGQNEKDRLADTCAPTETCAASDVSAARTKLIVADVSLLVGIAGAAAFGVLLYTSSRSSTSPASAQTIKLRAAPTSGGLFGALEYSLF